MQDQSCWNRFVNGYREFPAIALSLDHSRVSLPANYFRRRDVQARARRAFAAMAKLENGALANPDEQRMVGHYWLRNAGLAPTPELKREIEQTVRRVKKFAAEVHSGKIRGRGGKFANLLVIGIGGSALGPQFVANALGHPQTDRLQPFFFDNTDPDGMDKVLARLEGQLGRTLCVVISKSGTTPETYNGMIEARAAYDAAGLTFARHAVAITQDTSKLGQQAQAEKWLSRFPMWDWVGGRTSETSAVGLLPAALQGLAIDRLLAGAGAGDELTRVPDLVNNPAALLAELWYFLGEGRGGKDMVVIPYKDRLDLLSKYLQQLVMESLGKEKDLKGRVVNQGLAVYGNKGSTDQHAYVQQLRDGLANFFAVFIEVLKDRAGRGVEITPGVTSGDFLNGFLLGTRSALHDNGRASITLTVDEVSPFTVGVLIALFERTVGFYATHVGINAYHQPGVEAGKKAAAQVIDLQKKVQLFLEGVTAGRKGRPLTAVAIADAVGETAAAETVFKICQHLSANGRGLRRVGGQSAADALFAAR